MIYYTAILESTDYDIIEKDYNRIKGITFIRSEGEWAKGEDIVPLVLGLETFIAVKKHIKKHDTVIVVVNYNNLNHFHNAVQPLRNRGYRTKRLTIAGRSLKSNIDAMRRSINYMEEMRACGNLLMDLKILMSRIEYLRLKQNLNKLLTQEQ
jgi:hypothetical protein